MQSILFQRGLRIAQSIRYRALRSFQSILSAYLMLMVCSLELQAAQYASQPHVDIELVHGNDSLKAGTSLDIGILFKLEEGWHIYWQNPGDTGLAPTINWQLPQGFEASDIQWPTPSIFPVAHLVNFGYEHEVLLSAKLRVPDDFSDAHAINIVADLSWLVCKEACIPGQATLNLELPSVKTTSQGQTTTKMALFDDRRLPRAMEVIGGQAEVTEGDLNLELYAPQLIFKDAERVEVFVKNLDLVKYAPAKKIEWNNNRLFWRQARSEFFMKKPDQLDFVVVIDKAKAYDFSMPIE